MIGGSRQSVNRLLADFVDEGLLRFEGDTLVITDPRVSPERRVDDRPGRRGRERRRDRWPRSRAGSTPRRGSNRRAGAAVLRSIVDATVALFDAEAASLALHDPATDRLVFRVAAGEHGQGVVGLTIAPGQGVAGYVQATGQPLALSDVAADPRFGRAAAEQTGYVPRSLLAVPLVDETGVLGVLEVLDRRDGGSFDLRDIELASVFARQASVAIRATGLERDAARSFAMPWWRSPAPTRPGSRTRTIDALVERRRPSPATRTTRSGASPIRSPVSTTPDPADVRLHHRDPRRAGPTRRAPAGHAGRSAG